MNDVPRWEAEFSLFLAKMTLLPFSIYFFSEGLTVGLTTAAGLCLVHSNKVVKTLL